MKRKPQASPQRSRPTRGKTPKLGASSPSPSAKVWVKGQVLPSLAEVPRVPGPWHRSSSAAMAKDSSGRVVEPPLEVMLIYVWNPSAQSIELPPPMPEDVGRGHFGAEGEEDSLLSNTELAAGAVSSILRDSDLRRADRCHARGRGSCHIAPGVVSVSSCAFICPSHHCFTLYINFTSFLDKWLPI